MSEMKGCRTQYLVIAGNMVYDVISQYFQILSFLTFLIASSKILSQQ